MTTTNPDGESGSPIALSHSDRSALGREVARLRQIADLTQTALARLAGISPAVLSRYERGGRGAIELRILHRIAAGLGTTAGALIDALPATIRPVSTPPSPVVLLAPFGSGAGHHSAAAPWNLIQYIPRPLGQRWEGATTAHDRTLSRSALDWASVLIGYPVEVSGYATDLAGARSWYLSSARPTSSSWPRP